MNRKFILTVLIAVIFAESAYGAAVPDDDSAVFSPYPAQPQTQQETQPETPAPQKPAPKKKAPAKKKAPVKKTPAPKKAQLPRSPQQSGRLHCRRASSLCSRNDTSRPSRICSRPFRRNGTILTRGIGTAYITRRPADSIRRNTSTARP